MESRRTFCDSEFFDLQTVWNTTQPDFSPCFQKTVVQWTPCAFLLLITPLRFYQLSRHNGKSIPVTSLYVMKTDLKLQAMIMCIIVIFSIGGDEIVIGIGHGMTRSHGSSQKLKATLFLCIIIETNAQVLAMCIALVGVLDIIKTAYEFGSDRYVPTVNLVSPMFPVLTMVLAVILIQRERNHGVKSSGVMCIFWILFLSAELIIFQSKLRSYSYMTDRFHFMTSCCMLTMGIGQFILTFFVDRDEKVKVQVFCPEENSSYLSKITFSWFTETIKQGYKKPLKENDIFELISEDRSENVIAHFDKYWQKELDKQKKLKQQQTNSDLNGKYYETNKPSGSFNTVPQMKVIDKKSEYKANLLFAVIQAYWPHHLLSAGFKIVLNVTQYSTPLVLMWLIKFTENKEYMWRGYLYAVVMLVVKSIRSLLLNNNGDNNQRLARRIMTALRSLIFRKMTKLSNTARKSCTSGELVNLLSVDTNAFADLVHYWNSFWSAPLEIVMTLYMLYQNLGSCVFLGAAIMAVLFPINGYLAKFTREFHTQQMELKDSRIKHMNEILNGIKVLKLYAWEKSFEQQILEIRNKELTIVKKMKCLHAIMSCIWNIAPFLIIIVTFTMYVLMDPNNALNAKKLFVALSLFDILRHQMRELTHVLTNLIPVSVSFMRLQNFLNSEELNPDAILKDPTAENAISIKEGTFTWDREYKATLRDLNLEIPDGSLVAIVGTVGSGKSSLLSAILGEMDKLYGEVNVKGSVAYVAQQAWIQNTSLQNNILFGSTLEQQKYDGIIKACALQSDLDNLPGGDSAEIGEKGINLSGGQKQRVSLARAVYQDADIYLFDDPLSAVDAHVGKHLFQQVLGPNGILKDKTRVMVTHGVSFLSKVDKIVVLVEGEISEVGSYKDLLANDGAFAQFLKSYAAEHKTTKIEPESSSDESSDEEKVDSDDKKIKSLTTSEQKKNKLENLIDEEALETGSVEWSVYVSYLKAVGPVVIAIYAVLFLILQGTEIFSNLWLGRWTGDKPTGNVTVDADVRNWRLKSYGIIGLLSGLTCLLLEVIKMIGTVKATKYLHNMLLRNVFRLPMIFFDTTPIGRIVNRFSKDIEVMDGHIPNLFCTTFRVTIETVSILAVICFNIPMFMFVLIPLVGFYVIIQKFYIATSRQIRRIEQKNRSPVFSHFSESIAGISTIRAFGHQQRFIMESQNRVEELNKSVIANVIAHNWLAVRLDMLANCMVVFSAILLVVIGRDTIRPSVIAWTITSALDITHYMNWMVNISSALETEIVSVERVKEYSELPTEADWEKEEKKPEPQWPEKGVVQFKDFGMRYRKGLDLVIKGISCDIKPGEKIGIVGRTGAGKSSLTMALFRIIEKAQGSIMIDGVDISTLGLHDLRSKLTIIPQDPVLFSGTLRMNLDPFNDCTDEQVWTVLKHAHLYGFVSGLPDRLMHKCVEGGENLSVGQRQLICLARALLRKTKILVLDEATAAVDLEMDDLIQKTIRKEFSDCTILTIAHRLNTITDYTRIMVLDGGRICEFNSPQSLLKDTSGVFYGMAKDAGLVS